MNKSLATIAAVLIGLAVLFSFLDKPDDVPQPPEPKANIAAQARASVAAYALCLSANAAQAADKLKSGEFKNSDAVHNWLAKQNEAGRKESFKGWGEMLDEAIKAERLEGALRESATGFGKVK